jgi:hypothetical protein
MAPQPGAPDTSTQDANAPGAAAMPLHTAVQTANAGNFLWSEAIAVFAASAKPNAPAPMPLAVGRPVPFGSGGDSYGDDAAQRTPYVTLHSVVRAGETKLLRLLPIQVQPAADADITATAPRYNAAGIQLIVWPNASTVRPQSDEFSVTVSRPGTSRIAIHHAPDGSDGYRLPPGSRHRVTITDLAAPPATAPLPSGTGKKPGPPSAQKTLPQKPTPTVHIHTADAQGRLMINATGACVVVEVAPLG